MPSDQALQQLDALMRVNPGKARAAMERIVKRTMIPYEGWQAEVARADQRFQIVCAGRRAGKTKLAVRKALAKCRKRNQVVWWCSPTYKVVRRAYREALRQIPPGMLSKAPPPPTADGRLILHFKSGSVLEYYSAENPDAMIGEGVNYVVIDEAATIRETVWQQTIRPTLMDTGGSAFLISTPRGFNWFKRLWDRGQDAEYPAYASWHAASWESPYIPKEEIDEMRQSLPTLVFEQEVAADFLSEAGMVFRWTDAALREVVEGETMVVLGVDLAKHQDFTVIDGVNAMTREPCYHDRFHQVSWPIQKQRIIDAYDSFEAKGIACTIALDSTGIGDVVFDDLENEGCDVFPIKFTNTWKQQAVNLLAADLERGDAFIRPDQVSEFQSYGYEVSEVTGRFKYGAVEGAHDDEVSAKLCQHWAVVNGGPPNVRGVSAEDGDDKDSDEQGRIATVQTDETAAPPPAHEEIMRRGWWPDES
jgi:hypothetical protein